VSRFESADYAHYPQPEEYLGELTGRQQFSLAYLAHNGDQYAIPVKLRSQLEFQNQSKWELAKLGWRGVAHRGPIDGQGGMPQKAGGKIRIICEMREKCP
jgi:hypothetical protein